MHHPLQQQVHSVGGRARRLVLMHGASLAIAVIVAAALAAGAADYLIRYRDHGVRLIVSLLFLGVAGWGVWRFFWPAWRYRPNDVETARRIERRFPVLRDRLSSSISFLNEPEDEPRAGSAELRRAVISETQAKAEQLNLHEAIEPRPARKALLAALGVAAVVAALCWLDPASAGLAARRLAMPWSSETWPLWNRLAFENPPRRLAKGDNFEVELIDKNRRLPDTVQIQYWFEGEEPSEIDNESMKLLGDKMLARRENVTRSFRYRAIGGDDHTMPWISLEVVEPPQVAGLTIRLHPPAYTGWTVEESGPNIRALQGTRVEMRGTSAKPLRAARIVIDAEQDQEIPLLLGSEGHAFDLPSPSSPPTANDAPAWQVAASGSWRLLLTDVTGVTGGGDTRYELQAVPDRPPTVTLDGDDAVAYVTAKAIVPVRGMAKDDLALHTIDLRYLDSAHSDQDHQSISIARGPDQAAAAPAAPAGMGEGQTQAFDYTWDLAQMPDLAPGVQLTYHVAAADYKPQEDKSDTRRLVVISDREMEDRIGRRHSDILARLAEALDKQRAVRSQINSLEIQLEEAGAFAPRDLDHLQSAELNQRQVQRMLAGAPEAVDAQIARLLADVQNNRVDNPDVQRRMEELLTKVRQLGREQLPAVQSDLIDALKEAQVEQQQSPDEEPAAEPETTPSEKTTQPAKSPAGAQAQPSEETAAESKASPAEEKIPAAKVRPVSETPTAKVSQSTAERLHKAGEHQDAVIAALEQMLGELSQWDNYRRVARDIHQLRREQEDLAGRTNNVRLQTLGKEQKDLSPQERAATRRLAQQQGEIASRFEDAQARMREMAGELEATDPLAAETLADALDAAQRAGLSGKMQASARNLEQNRLGQAARQQQETAETLEELLNVLSNRREHELSRLVEKLRGAADELQEKQKQIKELRKKLEQAAGQQDPAEQQRQLERLAQEQQQLAKDIDRLARRLQRLQAEQAGQSLSQGAENLGQAGEQSQAGDPQQALERQEQAEQDLEDAQQELQKAIAQAEKDLFFEQMARLEQAIAGMIKRQQSVVDETARLAQLQAHGELTRGQLASVAGLAAAQRALADEAGQFAEKIAQAEAFEFALRGAMREMILTASRLERGEIGPPAQESAQAALARLERLAEALKTDASEKQDQAQPSPSEQESNQLEQPPGDGIAALAELKLLKLMQEELNARTAALADAREAQGELTPEQEEQLAELSQEQGRLAEILLNLGAPKETAHDDLENPPAPAEEGKLAPDVEKSLEQLLPDGLELQE